MLEKNIGTNLDGKVVDTDDRIQVWEDDHKFDHTSVALTMDRKEGLLLYRSNIGTEMDTREPDIHSDTWDYTMKEKKCM